MWYHNPEHWYPPTGLLHMKSQSRTLDSCTEVLHMVPETIITERVFYFFRLFRFEARPKENGTFYFTIWCFN